MIGRWLPESRLLVTSGRGDDFKQTVINKCVLNIS